MELREIKRMVFGGENDKVEFKRKINHPEKVVREIVAFANTQGGYLIVGVDDDQSIVGLKYAEEEDFLMQKAIRELIRPAITFVTHVFNLSEKRSLLVYEIPKGPRKPYFAFEQKRHHYGKAFVRVKDRSIQASPEIRKILKLDNSPKDVQFAYGPNEKTLFNYLNDHEYITLSLFREITGLDYATTSQTLVQMVAANVLKILPREGEDWYISKL